MSEKRVSCYKIISVNFFLELLLLKKLIFLFSTEFTFKLVFKVVTNIYPSYILILNSFQFSYRAPHLWKIRYHQENQKECPFNNITSLNWLFTKNVKATK